MIPPLRDWFANIFASTSVIAIRKEFEELGELPWHSITEDIRNPDTHAVFVLLGQSVLGSQYTLNWIAFEVGVAAGAGKDVWVFEEYNSPVEFPVPYVSHYMRYVREDKEHFSYIKSIIEGYLPRFPGQWEENVTRSATEVVCPYDNCRARFFYHDRENELRCPTCRQSITFNTTQQGMV